MHLYGPTRPWLKFLDGSARCDDLGRAGLLPSGSVGTHCNKFQQDSYNGGPESTLQ
jgi:hypothetical protein